MSERLIEHRRLTMSYRRNAVITGAVTLSSLLALGAGVAAGAAPAHTSSPAAHLTRATQATLHTTTTRVGARTETILVNAKGLPLYYYQADTAKKSQVSGGLAHLWPALISAKPTASGLKGKVASSKQADGRQVTYNGRFLYTFVDDSAGHVTGQGVSDFFVATPNVHAIGSATTAKAVPAPVASSRGYGY
jgi:predicted lipoprotein with Yx(FWY)xxD motif